MVFFLRLGVLLLTFFIFNVVHAENTRNFLVEKALSQGIYKNPKWFSLLHVNGSKLNITDNRFILSLDNFSLQNELIKTINIFFNDDLSENHPICRFPARYEFIKKELEIDDSYFPNPDCKGFKEYLSKTKADNVSLVFVSEDVSNPSSMMGHTFFKISGDNKSHAVSFFTVIDTFNLASLIFRSTLTGMKGFFSLTPYEEQIYRYLKLEDRNVWEYVLNLSEYDKKLMYYHFWELKDLDMKYFFTGFNCATVVLDILSISNHELTKKYKLWVTPKDVAKAVNKAGMVESVSLLPSDKWYIKMLSDYSDKELMDYIYKFIIDNNVDELLKDKSLGFVETEFLKTYINFLYNKNLITKQKVKDVNDFINNNKYDNYKIDLSNYKSPIKTKDDSQVSFSYVMKNKKSFLGLEILPASGKLSDDNREYFSESSLSISEFSFLLNHETIVLDSFTLYEMKSIVPYSKFTKDISAQLKIKYESHYDKKMSEHKAINISGGAGLDFKIFKDIDVYLLFNLGLAYGGEKIYPYLYPEFGLIMYQIFDMKGYLRYINYYNQVNSSSFYNDIQYEHSIFINKRSKIGFIYSYKFNRDFYDRYYGAGITLYF